MLLGMGLVKPFRLDNNMTQKVHGAYRPAEVLSGDNDFYTAYSLIDITDSGYTNPKGGSIPFKQAQNLNTLIQILSLRTQLVLSSIDLLEAVDLSEYDFGSEYTGIHNVWVFRYATETSDVWRKDDDPLYFSKNDCDSVPIHLDLHETVSTVNYFKTSDIYKNLYFTMSKFL